MPNFWQTGAPHILNIQWFPLRILIFGQKSCFLGPTIFKIPQPNWYYCARTLLSFWHSYMNIRDIKMRKEEVALNSTSLLSFKVHEIDRYSPMSKEFLGEIHIYIFYTSSYLIARPGFASLVCWCGISWPAAVAR